MTTELDLKQETNVVKFDPSIILEDAGNEVKSTPLKSPLVRISLPNPTL